MTATLLGPSARPMVALGGDTAWRHRIIRGIHCSFQWLDLSAEGMEPTNPCLCLFRPDKMAQGAYVIPQQNAYRYGHPDGTPTQHLLTAAFAATQKIGFDVRDRQAIRQVIDIIIESLPDLIGMPSEPPADSDVIVKEAVRGIEATARVNGRTVHEELL